MKQYYHPMLIRHMSDKFGIQQYGLNNTWSHAYLLFHAIQNNTDYALRDAQIPIDTLRHAVPTQTELWRRCQQLSVTTPPARPQHMLYDS